MLDANALVGVFEGRSGAEPVKLLIKQARTGEARILISLINWGEVYYVIWRNRGPAAAEKALQQIAELPIQVIHPDGEMTRLAASFRVRCQLPYADGFAAALAQKQEATLVTGDRDFASLAKSIRIRWLAAP